MKAQKVNTSFCPITGFKFSSDKPHRFQEIKAKREWRRRTYQPKKTEIEAIVIASKYSNASIHEIIIIE